MSESQAAELSIANINSKVKSRFHLYCILSQIYRLPSFTSKAITVTYLKAYLNSPCQIFRLKRKDFHPPFIVTKHCNAKEILRAIEMTLQLKQLPPIGLDAEKLPDIEWLLGIYFFLSPGDEYNLFPKSIKPETTVAISVDSE
jgi:hypothetical protein